jgi:hypothetical protein
MLLDENFRAIMPMLLSRLSSFMSVAIFVLLMVCKHDITTHAGHTSTKEGKHSTIGRNLH